MNQQRAFTLVELSIVLVILGLLIGGVLTGQTLIRASELRSVTTQANLYITATQTFRDKYFGLPGDITNATSYWGAADGSTGLTAACLSTSGGTATCNGNGDGAISYPTGTSNERMRYWQQLANAGLIEGRYDGLGVGTANTDITATNVPFGRISSSRWYVANWVNITGSTSMFDGNYDNTLRFGVPVTSNTNAGGVVKPDEAYNVDTKVDDGKPATGKIVTAFANTTQLALCTDTNSVSNMGASYLLTGSSVACVLQWRQAF